MAAVARLKMEAQLRGALARREFVLHYQPKASLTTGNITGFEALLRWQHPAHGLVPPLQFISVLEDTGLIVSVGEWVSGQSASRFGNGRTRACVASDFSQSVSTAIPAAGS